MSGENVEIIRRGYEHWTATGEIRAHPDFVWDVSRLGWPDQQIYAGAEGANRFNAEWADAWDGWELEVEDLVDAGESVVAIVNQRGRSKATGIPVDMRFAQVWTFRDGQAIGMKMYASVDEALEAAGMSQEKAEVENVVVRRWLWAFENDAEAFQGTLHQQIEWFQIEEDRSPVYGIDGAMQARSRWLDTWDEHRLDVEEVSEAGDSVVVSIHITARGQASGVEVDVRFHAHFKVRDDKVVYIFDHEERAAALEAAGLSD